MIIIKAITLPFRIGFHGLHSLFSGISHTASAIFKRSVPQTPPSDIKFNHVITPLTPPESNTPPLPLDPEKTTLVPEPVTTEPVIEEPQSTMDHLFTQKTPRKKHFDELLQRFETPSVNDDSMPHPENARNLQNTDWDTVFQNKTPLEDLEEPSIETTAPARTDEECLALFNNVFNRFWLWEINGL